MSHHLAFEGLISTLKLDDPTASPTPWRRT
jgi:hypothetical protein